MRARGVALNRQSTRAVLFVRLLRSCMHPVQHYFLFPTNSTLDRAEENESLECSLQASDDRSQPQRVRLARSATVTRSIISCRSLYPGVVLMLFPADICPHSLTFYRTQIKKCHAAGQQTTTSDTHTQVLSSSPMTPFFSPFASQLSGLSCFSGRGSSLSRFLFNHVSLCASCSCGAAPVVCSKKKVP